MKKYASYSIFALVFVASVAIIITIVFSNKTSHKTTSAWSQPISEDRRTPLHYAAGFNQDEKKIMKMIESGANIDIRDGLGALPLHWAVVNNPNPNVIKALLDADPIMAGTRLHSLLPRSLSDPCPLEDITLIHLASAKNTNPNVIITLLDAGLDIDARVTEKGITPLHLAASLNSNPEIINKLLDIGSEINARTSSGDTPLHLAATYNANPDVINTLLDAGSDINSRTIDGFIPLHFAIAHNTNPDVVMALLNAGSEIEAHVESGITPLHLVAGVVTSTVEHDNFRVNSNFRLNCRNIVDELRHFGTEYSVSKESTPGNTKNTIFDVTKTLLGAGSDINSRDKKYDATPLHWAVINDTQLDVIMALLDAGSDISARTRTGHLPLHLAAAKSSNPDVIKALLGVGCDINAQTTVIPSHMFYPAKPLVSEQDIFLGSQEWRKVQSMLLFNKQLNSSTNPKFTPLHLAVIYNTNIEVIKVLLDTGCDINTRTNTGDTPLHLASEYSSNPNVISLLLGAGASPIERNNLGKLPVELASNNSNINNSKVYWRLNDLSFN